MQISSNVSLTFFLIVNVFKQFKLSLFCWMTKTTFLFHFCCNAMWLLLEFVWGFSFLEMLSPLRLNSWNSGTDWKEQHRCFKYVWFFVTIYHCRTIAFLEKRKNNSTMTHKKGSSLKWILKTQHINKNKYKSFKSTSLMGINNLIIFTKTSVRKLFRMCRKQYRSQSHWNILKQNSHQVLRQPKK